MAYIVVAVCMVVAFNTAFLLPTIVSAQDNPNSSGYKLAVCDGPAGALDSGGVACDFNGLLLLVQHLIPAALVFGVFVAIAGFCWIGYLLISGTQENRKRAKDIFPKIFWGFIIMLTAWFFVYQILNWFANSSFQNILH